MSLRTTVILSVLLWTTGISALHGCLNLSLKMAGSHRFGKVSRRLHSRHVPSHVPGN